MTGNLARFLAVCLTSILTADSGPKCQYTQENFARQNTKCHGPNRPKFTAEESDMASCTNCRQVQNNALPKPKQIIQKPPFLTGNLQLVFLIDGRNWLLSDGMAYKEYFAYTREWIHKVVKSVSSNMSKDKENFLIVIQYAEDTEISLVDELDENLNKIEQKITEMKGMDSKLKNSEDALFRSFETLKTVYVDGKIPEQDRNNKERKTMWKSIIKSGQEESTYKLLYAYAHRFESDHAFSRSLTDAETKQLEKITSKFNRVDLVTVGDQNSCDVQAMSSKNEEFRNSLNFLSERGIRYDYANHVELLSGVNEITQNIGGTNKTPLELAVMVDLVWCKCEKREEQLFKNIQKFLCKMTSDYRRKHGLVLGQKFSISISTYWWEQPEKEGDEPEKVKIQTILNISEWDDTNERGTTSFDLLKTKIQEIDYKKEPYSKLCDPRAALHMQNVIPMYKVLEEIRNLKPSAKEILTNQEDTDRILVILPSEAGDGYDLEANMEALHHSFEMEKDHNLAMIGLPIRTRFNYRDNKNRQNEISSDVWSINEYFGHESLDRDSSMLEYDYDWSESSYQEFMAALNDITWRFKQNSADGGPDDIISEIEFKYWESKWVCDCDFSIKVNVSTECLVGPKGPKGPEGAIGERGPPGLIGKTGMPGINGNPGKNGAPGEKGDSGLPGLKGAKGEVGIQGPDGEAGEIGAPGEKGDAGLARFTKWNYTAELVKKHCNCHETHCKDRRSPWFTTHNDKNDVLGLIGEMGFLTDSMKEALSNKVKNLHYNPKEKVKQNLWVEAKDEGNNYNKRGELGMKFNKKK